MSFDPIVRFAAAWNGNTNRGTLLLRKPNNDTETLTNLSMQKFTLLLTLLQGSQTIWFDEQTGSMRTETEDVA